MDGQDDAKQSTTDMTAFVQNLLQQMFLNKAALDEMGNRIDELEQSINDLRTEMAESLISRSSVRRDLSKCRMKKDKTWIFTSRGNDVKLIFVYYVCSSATNRLITSKDHASVQLNIGHVDERGIYTGQFSTFALCGFIRAQGDADSALDRLWQKKKVEARQQ
ncbi:hypothetical protein SASPL_112371 [Salvia splendens]|uniref:40S ribosomal protein S21 n=1 Tax=Salvia splendens TaxID=180675 RepID=A0A8X8YCJ1_SALSN|nr:hypothetical protein SASPL_112371 [Salvia splendens]